VEQNKKMALVFIIIVILLAAVLITYYGFIAEDDNGDNDNNGNGDDDVGDDDDDVGDDDDTPPADRVNAVISAPDEAYQFYEVTFDASGSTDPDGLALTYSWDFDKDGSEDADTAVATYAFQELGAFTVDLAVQNPDDRTDTASHTITIVAGTGHPEHENLTLDEGNTGQIYKKAVGDSDVIKHWDMPADITRVEATLYWTDEDWEFRFSMGTGADPDTGTILVDDTADSGPLTITYFVGDGETVPTGQWFLRVGILNEGKHQAVIDLCDYEIGLKVYYITPDEM